MPTVFLHPPFIPKRPDRNAKSLMIVPRGQDNFELAWHHGYSLQAVAQVNRQSLEELRDTLNKLLET